MKPHSIYFKTLATLWLLCVFVPSNGETKIFHASSSAETAQVWGDLIVESLNSNPQMTIRTSDRDIKLTNVHIYREGCLNGTYKIQKDSSGQGHILLDVMSCEEEIPVIGQRPHENNL